MKRIILYSALFTILILFTIKIDATDTITKPLGIFTVTAEIHSSSPDSPNGYLHIKGNNIEIVSPIPVHFTANQNPQNAGNNYIGTFIKNVNGQPVTYYVYLSGASPRVSLPFGSIRQA